jgi:hypothetical protein
MVLNRGLDLPAACSGNCTPAKVRLQQAPRLSADPLISLCFALFRSVPLCSAMTSVPASDEAPPSSASSFHGDCKWCGYPGAKRTYDLTQLKPLCLHETPLHHETDDRTSDDDRPSLFTFIYNVLKHMYEIDFGDKDENWVQAGHYPPSGTGIDVIMPPFGESVEPRHDIRVPIHVEKWASNKSSNAWLGRQSYHSDDSIIYGELHELLAVDHCRKERIYTPSVFDAVRLVNWEEQNLQAVATELNMKEPGWKIHSLSMSSE